MTRHTEPGAHRNLIGLKVSDDMLAAIEAMRGDVPVQDFLRGLISAVVQQAHPPGSPDWERRARDAERMLVRLREVLASQ